MVVLCNTKGNITIISDSRCVVDIFAAGASGFTHSQTNSDLWSLVWTFAQRDHRSIVVKWIKSHTSVQDEIKYTVSVRDLRGSIIADAMATKEHAQAACS